MDVIETVEKSVEGKNVKRVTQIELELGEFDFVTPEQLAAAFEIASDGTIAKGAKLKIKTKHGKIKCNECGYVGKVEVENKEHSHLLIHCPKCDSVSVEVLEGKRLIVKNIRALTKA